LGGDELALKDLIKNIFTKDNTHKQYAKFLDGYAPIFSQFGRDIYASDVVQSCIDIIATECSKLAPKHIRTDNNGMQQNVKSSLNRLMKFSPNELMTTRDFIEKIVWLLFLNYNAFVYPTYDIITSNGISRREYTGLYPINPTQVDFLQDEAGTLFIRFLFTNGQDYTLPYSDVIHLRKKFSVNEIMGGGLNGQPDNTAILKVLEINDTVLQGLDKAIRTSLNVRGVLKINTMMDDAAQQAERKKFEAALKNNESGILPLDLKGDYHDIKVDPKIVDKDTLQFLENKVLNYYGVSVPILTGDFTDEQYQAFYEKTLEPIIISLGQAFSKTLFTTRELDVGNELVFYPQMLLFTNTKNKIAVADILGNRGALTNNELLQLFGYPPYVGGDVRNMSLNYIDVTLANDYQMKRAGSKGTEVSNNGKE
jgi:HK97 family phage portal protein